MTDCAQRRMRVLLVSNEDPGKPLGGLGEFVYQLKYNLGVAGVEARTLFVDYSPEGSRRRDGQLSSQVDYYAGIDFVSASAVAEVRSIDAAYQILCNSLPALRGFQPDVIHCNDRQAYLPFRGLPNVVFSLHLSYTDLHVALNGLARVDESLYREFLIDRHAVERAPVTVVYSEFMRQRVWKHISFSGKCLVLPLGGGGVSAALLNKPRPKPRVISYFGRFHAGQKGFLVFLEACILLQEGGYAGEGVEFRVHGNGVIPDRYRSISYIRFCGMVRGRQRDTAYRESDIVIMPSKYEPFGIVGLEALGFGCLLIATGGMGMDEYLRPGWNGLAVESTPESIRDTVVFALNNWEECQRMALQARDDARQWTWQRSAAAHAAVYSSLCDGWSDNLRIAGDPRYPALKRICEWPGNSSKPGVSEAVLRHAAASIGGRSAAVWNPCAREKAALGQCEGVDFVSSSQDSLCTLETALLVPELARDVLVVLSGFEFTLDPLRALGAVNRLPATTTLFIGFYRGERVRGQTARLEHTDEAAAVLTQFKLSSETRCGDSVCTVWEYTAV